MQMIVSYGIQFYLFDNISKILQLKLFLMQVNIWWQAEFTSIESKRGICGYKKNGIGEVIRIKM